MATAFALVGYCLATAWPLAVSPVDGFSRPSVTCSKNCLSFLSAFCRLSVEFLQGFSKLSVGFYQALTTLSALRFFELSIHCPGSNDT